MTFFIGKGGVSIKWNGPRQLMSIFTDLLFACYGLHPLEETELVFAWLLELTALAVDESK